MKRKLFYDRNEIKKKILNKKSIWSTCIEYFPRKNKNEKHSKTKTTKNYNTMKRKRLYQNFYNYIFSKIKTKITKRQNNFIAKFYILIKTTTRTTKTKQPKSDR